MLDQLIHQLVVPVLYILAIVLPLVLAVAMFVYWERKVLGWMHVRMGPNKIGPFGVLQAFADVVKLLIKEVILPTKANRFLYYMAPMIVASIIKNHPHWGGFSGITLQLLAQT